MLNLRRNGWALRIIAIFVLVVDIPFMAGLDRVIYSIAAQGNTDPEDFEYETQVTPQIAGLAEDLGHSAPRIFDWVRTNVRFEPYKGSVKGGQGTLSSRCGNDLDQAMLLAALLKASGIQWRLAVGDVTLTIEEAQNWLGVAKPSQVLGLLEKSGIAYSTDSHATPSRVTVKNHHWIQIHSNFFPLRGVSSDDILTGTLPLNQDPVESWVALDPSVTYTRPREAALITSFLGEDPDELLDAIRSNAVSGSESNSYTSLPSGLITSAAVRAATALRDRLEVSGMILDELLGTSHTLQLARREALPGNLPYKIENAPVIYAGEEVKGYLNSNGIRRKLMISLRQKNGMWSLLPGSDITISTVRLMISPLSVSFSATDPESVNALLNSREIDVAQTGISLDLEYRLNGVPLTLNLPSVPLGSPLWMEIKEESSEGSIKLPIIAGGRYLVNPFAALDEEAHKDSTLKMQARLQALNSEGDYVGEGEQNGPLSAYLKHAAALVSQRTYEMENVAAGVAGYQWAGWRGMTVTGLEPGVSDNKLISPDLVVHYIPAESAGTKLAAAVNIPGSSAGRVTQAAGLLRNLGLSSALKELTGSGGWQSVTRLLSISADKSLGIVHAVKNTQRELPLSIPSFNPGVRFPGLNYSNDFTQPGTALRDRVRISDLSLTGMELLNTELETQRFTALGEEQEKNRLGWGFWETASASGIAVNGYGQGRQAWAPVLSLYPLDLVAQGSRERYKEMLYYPLDSAESFFGVTAALKQSIAGVTSLILPWLPETAENSDPLAIPSASIALHGAAQWAERPRIDALVATPEILSTLGSDVISGSVHSSIDVDHVLWRVEDAQGAVIVSHTDNPDNDIPPRTYFRGNLLEGFSGTVLDGVYKVICQVATRTGAVSEEASTSFIIDNSAPEVFLATSSQPASGQLPIMGSVNDANLESWTLDWKLPSDTDFQPPIASGQSAWPLETVLATVDTHQMGWDSTVTLRLRATDKVSNHAQITAERFCKNDVNPPVVSVTNNAVALESGAQLKDTVTLGVSATDNTPTLAANRGLAKVSMRMESEMDANRAPIVLVDKTETRENIGSISGMFELDTTTIQQTYTNESWRIVAEAVDHAGNKTTVNTISNLTLGNTLRYFEVSPTVFRFGGKTGITFGFNEPRDCTLRVLDKDDSEVRILKPAGMTQSYYDFWTEDDENFPGGYYQIELEYEDGDETKKVRRNVTYLGNDNTALNPAITGIYALKSQEDHKDEAEIFITELAPGEAKVGKRFLASDTNPVIRIDAKVPPELKRFLDGRTPEGLGYPATALSNSGCDVYWALEFKSSKMRPTHDDSLQTPNSDLTVMDRTNWNLITWGNSYLDDGNVSGFIDSATLPSGYYDVRFWVTNGSMTRHHTVYFLKVTHGDEGASSGVDPASTLGAMTLSATDMTVPFDGNPVTIARDYNSNDIYESGSLGYGWRMRGIGLEIEHTGDSSGEADEAMIRLPDGRKFFFANVVPTTTQFATSAWAKYGEYLTRPFGMKLFRPGGSQTYHISDDGLLNVFQAQSMGAGAGTAQMGLEYHDHDRNVHFGRGEVAYLQTEDKTWYIFEWKTGRLIKTIKPDGQQVNYTKNSELEISISDTSGRSLTIEYEIDTGYISRITDPSNNFVTYTYDDYGNLVTVTDRSGRKRFYLYDTEETKALFPERTDLTGRNIHFLVDVRVDDDLSEGFTEPTIPGDTVPSPSDTFDAALGAQEYPGDISILKTSYENGKLSGIETYSGSVSMGRTQGENGSGVETVIGPGGLVAASVEYDANKRVTSQKDFWGNETTFEYNDTGAIKGVLNWEENALKEKTHYGYQAPLAPHHKSFADMFAAYVEQQTGDETGTAKPQGYLTSVQAQPSSITQGGQTTTIGYDLDSDSPSAFQPETFAAPGGAIGSLGYTDTGKLESVSVNGDDGPQTENVYYDKNTPGYDDEEEWGWVYGRLWKTIVKATPSVQQPRTTLYTYTRDKQTGEETHTVTDETTKLESSSVYDATGNLKISINSRGTKVKTETDGEGRVIKAWDEQDNIVHTLYNVLGLKQEERFVRVSETPISPVTIRTRYRYDGGGRTIETIREAIDPLNPQAEPRLLSRNRNEYREVDGGGRTETSIDTLNMKSRSHYDAGGRLVKTEQLDALDGVMASSVYQYDKLGRKVKETNNKGVVSETVYDELGRVESSTVTGPGINQESVNTYNDDGRLESTSYQTELGQTRYTIYEYDDSGRLTRTYYNCELDNVPSSIYTETKYDLKTGQRIEERDEEGIVTSYRYDPRGAVDRITLATTTSLTSHFTFETDDYGNQRKITNPLGHVREKVYDDEGRLEFEFGPVNDQEGHPRENKRSAVKYEYYASGLQKKKAEGSVPADSQAFTEERWTKFIYDPVSSQLIRREFSDDSKDVYTYTGDGRVLRVERWTASQVLEHSREFTYDPRTGQAATVASPEGTIIYTYHLDGSLATIKTSAGYDVAYTYDAMGNIKTVSGKSIGGIVTYTYNDKTGRKTKVERPNGVTTEYVYNTRGFLESITDAKGDSPVLTQSYTRYPRGLIKTLTEKRPGENATVWRYTYDDLKRLSTADAEGQNPASYSYTYDLAGNRETKTVNTVVTGYDYNALDQLILETPASGSAKSYEYDIYGNLTLEKHGSVTKRTYTWDGENRLKSVLLHENSKTYRFRYDTNGTRVKKIAEVGSQTLRTNYLSDYVNPSGYSQSLQETDEAGEGRAYIWSGEGILAQSGLSTSGESSGGSGPPVNAEFAHTDHLGTVKALTASTGAVVAGSALQYSPFGEKLPGTEFTTSYRFTGQYAEDELGVQYHRARWLNTSRAAWMSQDPVWDFPGNFGNAYGYAGQNPILMADVPGTFGSYTSTVGSVAVSSFLASSALGAIGGGIAGLIDYGIEGIIPGITNGLAYGALLGAIMSFAILGVGMYAGMAGVFVLSKLAGAFFTGLSLGTVLSPYYSKGTKIVAVAFMMIGLVSSFMPWKGEAVPRTALSSPKELARFSNDLAKAAKAEGALSTDQIGLRGSAILGRSVSKGTKFGPDKDADFFVVSDKLYRDANGKPGGNFLPFPVLRKKYPKIAEWADTTGMHLNREVRIRIWSEKGFRSRVQGTVPEHGPYWAGEIGSIR